MSFQSDVIRRIDSLNRQMNNFADFEIDMHRGIASLFLQLPGLVGYWPMSVQDTSSGNVTDQSGNGKTLVESGNSVFNVDGLAPYIAVDGTGDVLSRADEADLDITGTESHIDATIRGLTMGGWCYFDNTAAAAEYFMAKHNGAGNRSYYIRRGSIGVGQFFMSDDGTTEFSAQTTDVLNVASWIHVVGRFDPSTSLAIFINGAKTTNTTSIPASIFNSNAALAVGARDVAATNAMAGRVSNCFLCAAYLSDAIIKNQFHQTKGIYGA